MRSRRRKEPVWLSEYEMDKGIKEWVLENMEKFIKRGLKGGGALFVIKERDIVHQITSELEQEYYRYGNVRDTMKDLGFKRFRVPETGKCTYFGMPPDEFDGLINKICDKLGIPFEEIVDE